jgi:microcystin-dependent protein
MLFAGNFAPRNYAFCNGQLLAINSNPALFSLLGTTYGGNGVTTFALPDLRGRVPIHFGTLPGGSTYSLGELGGYENETLSVPQLPAHTHGATAGTAPSASSLPATETDPAGHVFAAPTDGSFAYSPTAAGGAASSSAGGGQSHTNMQPSLCINYCIALQGIFPSRN